MKATSCAGCRQARPWERGLRMCMRDNQLVAPAWVCEDPGEERQRAAAPEVVNTADGDASRGMGAISFEAGGKSYVVTRPVIRRASGQKIAGGRPEDPTEL